MNQPTDAEKIEDLRNALISERNKIRRNIDDADLCPPYLAAVLGPHYAEVGVKLRFIESVLSDGIDRQNRLLVDEKRRMVRLSPTAEPQVVTL